jgi:hypothetical protein
MTTWQTRDQWGARHPLNTRPLTGFNSGWFIHWLGEPAATGTPDTQVLRNTQRYHIDSKGWADIAYSFAVGRQHPDRAYELRGWGIAGGHTEGHNSQSMAIVFLLGTGEHPTDEMLATARSIITEGVHRGYPADLVRPHNAVRPTACPGPDLTAWINAGRFTEETTMPNSDPVKASQRRLNDSGAQPPLRIDGDWGPASDTALDNVLRFQQGEMDRLKASLKDIIGQYEGKLAKAKAERDNAVAQREAAELEAHQLLDQLRAGGRLPALLADLDKIELDLAAALDQLNATTTQARA